MKNQTYLKIIGFKILLLLFCVKGANAQEVDTTFFHAMSQIFAISGSKPIITNSVIPIPKPPNVNGNKLFFILSKC